MFFILANVVRAAVLYGDELRQAPVVVHGFIENCARAQGALARDSEIGGFVPFRRLAHTASLIHGKFGSDKFQAWGPTSISSQLNLTLCFVKRSNGRQTFLGKVCWQNVMLFTHQVQKGQYNTYMENGERHVRWMMGSAARIGSKRKRTTPYNWRKYEHERRKENAKGKCLYSKHREKSGRFKINRCYIHVCLFSYIDVTLLRSFARSVINMFRTSSVITSRLIFINI